MLITSTWKDKMTINELYEKISEILPNAQLDFDNHGQLVIYTDVMVTRDHKIIPFEMED